MKEDIMRELINYMNFFKEEYGLPENSFSEYDAEYLASKIEEAIKWAMMNN